MNVLACFDVGTFSASPRPNASVNVLERFGDGKLSIGAKLTEPGRSDAPAACPRRLGGLKDNR